jgi:hypothetical protein
MKNNVVDEVIATLEEILVQSEERNKRLKQNVINAFQMLADSQKKPNDYSVRVVIPPPLENGTCSRKCCFYYQEENGSYFCTRSWSVQLDEIDCPYSYGPGPKCPRYVQPVKESDK